MSAARSVQVNFDNQTPETLVLPPNGAGLSGGIWSIGEAPPSTIPPYSHVTWQSESDGFLTGTQGFASYVLQNDATQSFTVSWDDPYDGSNTLSATMAPQNSGYQLNSNSPDADADNVVFNVELSVS